MVSVLLWDVLKAAFVDAEENEKGVRVEAMGTIVCELSTIQKWKERYGQFAVQENEHRTLIFNATDILFIDGSGPVLVLQLKPSAMAIHR